MTISEERNPAEIAEELRLITEMRADEARSDEFLASLEHERERPRASYTVDAALISWEWSI